jgi:TonB family protein
MVGKLEGREVGAMRRIRDSKLAGVAVIAALCVSAFVADAGRSWATDETPTEALRGLMTTALTAARQGDQAKLEDIAHGLVIPNYETWFKATFGEEEGAKLAAAYAANLDRDEKWFPILFQGLSKQEGEVLVEDAREPRDPGGNQCGQALLRAAKADAFFYRVGLQRIQHDGLRRIDSAGYFTLVEGAYRRLDCRSLGLVPAPLPHPMYGPLRVGGNVQSAKIIKRVQPVYPVDAREARISGTVRLHVILAKDGTVGQLELMSGHPMLAQAAIDAVRQWTYQPTLLNGFPVEVDTTIDVIFALNLKPAQRP